MKTIIVSKDQLILKMARSQSVSSEFEITFYDSSKNPLELLDFIWQKNPSLLLIDDDFFQPNTAKFIETLKNVNSNINIIFLTSNPSIELGKKVSQLGIHYYAIKPLEELELVDLLNSVTSSKINNK